MSPTVNDRTAFRVRDFRPNEWMLWAKPDSTWCWRLDPIESTRTRLVSRIRAEHQFTSPSGLAGVALLELGDFPMNRRELLNIKQRAEAMAA
jgi:hypothetical protein